MPVIPIVVEPARIQLAPAVIEVEHRHVAIAVGIEPNLSEGDNPVIPVPVVFRPSKQLTEGCGAIIRFRHYFNGVFGRNKSSEMEYFVFHFKDIVFRLNGEFRFGMVPNTVFSRGRTGALHQYTA